MHYQHSRMHHYMLTHGQDRQASVLGLTRIVDALALGMVVSGDFRAAWRRHVGDADLW